MTLTDPCDALADESTFIGYLTGLAGVARLVRRLAEAPRRENPDHTDDFVDLLLGLASVGRRVEYLAAPPAAAPDTARADTILAGRWLR
ncbi:hypothetical protein [Mycobacterium sp. GA-2829]|uniref:hypothetical protein n=1 Tax=Mycobacterium sp. GA-2829 TaxID=1772283 RepID=UPI000740336A|nr:hypothetical protein [Mycobacterium sp. GA-2829]KUI33855.1 hypothetical protein AU194_15145 [Mycobacterium sp. GA-2829]